jgi:hypothetical protein
VYTLSVRYIGERAWHTGSSPLSLQAAYARAQVLSAQNRFADEVRVTPAAPQRLLDLRV